MRENRLLLQHAGTVLVGQLAVMAFGVTDTLIAGRYSPQALAVLALATSLYVSIYVALNGVLQALLPVWAQLHGAGKPRALGRSVRQALYLAALLLGVGGVILGFPQPWLHWADVPPRLWPEVQSYLRVLALALGPSLGFRMYGTLNQSLGLPRLVTVLQAAGLLVKVPLSVLLTFGIGHWEGLGVVGCAWATLIVQILMLSTGLVLLRTQEVYTPLRLWRRPEGPDITQLRHFLRLGLPAGLSVMVEVTSFTLMTLFIARMGETALASHQIAANLAAVLYMMPLAMGIAASARTGYWLGAGAPAQARDTARRGLKLAMIGAVASAGVLVALRQPLAQAFSADAAVATAAASWLLWVALYHLADAAQTVCVFLLRCYGITLSPLLIYTAVLWGVGLYGGYQLAYRGLGAWPAAPSVSSFWITSVLALVLVAVLFVWRLHRALHRPTSAGRSERSDKRSAGHG